MKPPATYRLRAYALALLLGATAVAGASEPLLFRAEIANPMTVAIRHSMEQRYSRLIRFYEPGVIGLGNDGMVAAVSDLAAFKIGTRQIVEKLIDAENDDRRQLLAAVALANGRGSGREPDLREAREAWLAKWRHEMKRGWMVQDDAGHWQRQP